MPSEGLCKEVSNLHGSRNREQLRQPCLGPFVENMAVDLQMLRALIKHWISGEMEGTTIVTIKHRGTKLMNVQVST